MNRNCAPYFQKPYVSDQRLLFFEDFVAAGVFQFVLNIKSQSFILIPSTSSAFFQAAYFVFCFF